jgi:hypothetical protein
MSTINAGSDTSTKYEHNQADMHRKPKFREWFQLDPTLALLSICDAELAQNYVYCIIQAAAE